MKIWLFSLFAAALGSLATAEMPSRLIQNLEAGNPQELIYYGTSLSSGEWTDQTTEVLRSRYGDLIKAQSRASGGRDSEWGLKNIADRVLSFNPDVVTIEFSMNDAIASRNISVKKARENLVAMIVELQRNNPNIEIILLTMNPVGGEASERPESHPYYRGNLPAYYQMVREVAAAWNIRSIDINAAWNQWRAEHPDLFAVHLPDGVHPDETACRYVILPEILKGLGVPNE